MTNFDAKALRQVYGQFPTGVTVITTRTADGEPIGFTASSFNSVSMDPPLILWSIDKCAYSLEAFQNCEYFAVHILSDKQIALSNRFAGRGEDKFSGLDYATGTGGSPLLAGALAQLQCKNWNIYEGGDHLIMVGEVIDFSLAESGRPLVFSQGSYSQASQHVEMKKNQQSQGGTFTIQQDFLNNHLLYLLRGAYNELSQSFYQKLNESKGISPEAWRVYACLADGNKMSLATLSDYVMQPQPSLIDTLSLMGNAQVTIDFGTNSACLTASGRETATALIDLSHQHDIELAGHLSSENLDEVKRILRKLV